MDDELIFSIASVRASEDVEVANAIATELTALGMTVIAVHALTPKLKPIYARIFKALGYSMFMCEETTSEAIFANKPVVKKEFRLFSKGKRGLSKFQINLETGKNAQPYLIDVATAHFDEGPQGSVARKAALAEFPAGLIFAGDISSPKFEALEAPVNYFDAWREKGSPDNELTDRFDRTNRIWWGANCVECVGFDTACHFLPQKAVWAKLKVLLYR